MSEKEDETFGQKITIKILVFAMSICFVTYTFNLFKPYISCVAVEVQGGPVLTQQDRAPS